MTKDEDFKLLKIQVVLSILTHILSFRLFYLFIHSFCTDQSWILVFFFVLVFVVCFVSSFFLHLVRSSSFFQLADLCSQSEHTL